MNDIQYSPNTMYTYILILVFKAFHNNLPSQLQIYYSKPNNHRITRQPTWNFTVKLKSTKIQNSRPSVAGPYLWNNLKANTKQKNCLNKFKNIISKELLCRVYLG